MQNDIKYPGGSKSRIDKAGNNLRTENFTDDDLRVFEEWRAAHRSVLNTFQASLRTRTKDKNITVAQRHKRKSTILNKLSRFPKMQLSRMDDVAGCRLIFENIEDLKKFRDDFHKARFRHKIRNEIDKYDYIKRPKDTGYRGIHDVYIYDVQSQSGKDLKGLYVEIQYRTLIQHAWDTTVEIIGSITENQPKFQQGDNRYINAMAYASEILARFYEKRTGPFPLLSDTDIVNNFSKIEKELSLLKTLNGVRASKEHILSKKNVILIFSNNNELEIKGFEYAPEAIKKLFDLEKEFPDKDIVLVRSEKSEDTRIAFRNYFSDTKDFITLLNDAIKRYNTIPSTL